MKKVFCVSLILAFSALSAHAAESCESLFEPTTRVAETTGSAFELSARDLLRIRTYDQAVAFTKDQVARNTDMTSIVMALQKTSIAWGQWVTGDVLFFLYHLEITQGIKISNFDFPVQDSRILDVKNIHSEFDRNRYILAQRLLKRPVEETLDSLAATEFAPAKKRDLVFLQLQVLHLYNSVKNFTHARELDPHLDNVFRRKSAELAKISKELMSEDQVGAEVTKLLAGDEKNPSLKTEWKVNESENLDQFVPGQWRLRKFRVDNASYIMNPSFKQKYVQIVTSAGRTHAPRDFFYSVYKNYQDRIRDEIVKLVHKVEDSLPVLRQAYAMVTALKNDAEVYGTMRVYDGTPRRLSDLHLSVFSAIPPVLPFEAIFKARNIPVKFIEKLERMRIEDPYAAVFEIGKLSLEGSPRIRDRALKSMELFLYQYYTTQYPNAIFVVHVASDAHLKLYQKRYGFEVTETVQIPGSDQVEYVLTLSGAKLREALRLRLGISSLDTPASPE